jgi:16S rRNA (guanine527-N7)-methyltransferase
VTGERGPADLDAEIDRVLGARAADARRFAMRLATDGVVRGVIGPREADRIWPRHLFNCAALAPLIGSGASVVDLGSGAGLPGIPLALRRPDLRIVLLEPMARRVRFLTDALHELDLPGVSVRQDRAERVRDLAADVVVARAVAPLPDLVTLAFPLCRQPARLLALKGAHAQAEAEAVAQPGAVLVETHTLEALGEPATVVEVCAAAS